MDNFYADAISQDPQFDSVKRVNDPDLDKRRQVTPRQRANRSSDRAAGSDGLVNFAPPAGASCMDYYVRCFSPPTT
jgi:hypothetical protein